jgi:hypothetical protein
VDETFYPALWARVGGIGGVAGFRMKVARPRHFKHDDLSRGQLGIACAGFVPIRVSCSVSGVAACRVASSSLLWAGLRIGDKLILIESVAA